MDDLKRSLDEITLLYKLEPETRDIYVEGISDKLLINRFIKKNEIRDVKIIHVHEVNFDSLSKENHKIKSNNKAKLLALNDYFERTFSEKLDGVLIIVDRDIDEFKGNDITGVYLIQTDYHSLELYMYNAHTLDIFYETYLHGFPINGQQTINAIDPVLVDYFLVRTTINKDGILVGNGFTPFAKSTSIDKNTVTIAFRFDEHILKILNNIKRAKEVVLFLDHYKNSKNNLTLQSKFLIRGHDFINLFFQLIDKVKNHIGLTRDTLERALFQCIDYSILKQENMFQYILNKYS